MQLFTRLMLDRPRIVLQTIDMSLKSVVLLPQIFQLPLQSPRILLLLLERDQPILAEHDMISHAQSQRSSCNRGKPPTLVVDGLKPTAHAQQFFSTLANWSLSRHPVAS